MPRSCKPGLWLTPLALGWWLLGGCPPEPGDLPGPLNAGPGLRAEYLVAPAAYPTVLAPAADGRVFYAEKETGQIRVIKDGVLLGLPFATMPVNYAGERGLLGLALHPAFENNGRVYAFYTRSDTGEPTADPQAALDHRVVYFEPAERRGDVSTGQEIFVASFPTAGSLTRVGGRMAFTADGMLFVALGDMGAPDAAQDPALPLGKVLCYRDDGTVPADNPVRGSAVFATGFCDPRGFALDPTSGALFLAEQCPGGLNEINRLQRGSNYGWPFVTGWADTAAELEFVALNPEYSEPLTQSSGAYVGAAFNPSGKYGLGPQLRLFYALGGTPRVDSLGLTQQRTAALEAQKFADGLPTPITDVAFTPAGTLYVACRDAVLRIVPFP